MVRPNANDVNFSVFIVGLSEFMSATHKNQRKSLCFGSIPMLRNAFSRSPISATFFIRNRSKMSNMSGAKLGPVSKQSLKLACPLRFELAS